MNKIKSNIVFTIVATQVLVFKVKDYNLICAILDKLKLKVLVKYTVGEQSGRVFIENKITKKVVKFSENHHLILALRELLNIKLMYVNIYSNKK